MGEAGESVAGNAAAGFREGVYGALGFPVDAATWLVNRGIDGVNAVAGSEISNLGDLPLGSRSIATNLEHYAGIPDPAKVRAVTLAEKAARAAGEGAAYAIAPQALLRAGAAGTRLSGLLRTVFGNSNTVREVVRDVAAGGIGGGVGTLAGEAAPEPLKPLAEFGGNLAGGGIVAAAEDLPRLIAQGGRAVRDFAAPLIGGAMDQPARPAMASAGGAPTPRPFEGYESRMAPPQRTPATGGNSVPAPGWSSAEIFAPPDPAAGRFRTDYPSGAPRADAFERRWLNQEVQLGRSAPRTLGLGSHASMTELLQSGALPGGQGVILTDHTVFFGDMYRLGTMNGRRVEFALTIEQVGGKQVKKLYSGDAWNCPVPRGVRIVGHVHPNVSSTQKWASPADELLLRERFFERLERGRKFPSKTSRIIWGAGAEDNTIVYSGFGKQL